MFPQAHPNAYAARLCTNESQWEERAHYELCIGCSLTVSHYFLWENTK